MKKFESTHHAIEVVQVAAWVPGFIHRQIITLLLALGVNGNVFERRARDMMGRLDAMLTDPVAAVSGGGRVREDTTEGEREKGGSGAGL